MDIIGNGRIHDKAASLQGVRSTAPDAATKRQGPSVAASKDSVDLSSRAKGLSGGHAALAALPDVRVDTVTELKGSIESDAYHVEGEQVSDAIVRETLLNAAL